MQLLLGGENMKIRLLLIPILALAALVILKLISNNPVIEPPKEVASAAVDYYLKVDGVEGEATTRGHEKEIQLLAWQWGDTSEIGLLVPAVQKIRDAAKAEFSDFHFKANMSKASPVLFKFAAKGEHIPEVKLTGLRAGGGQEEFMKITLKDAFISSYQTEGTGTDVVPTDSFSMNYAKVEFEFIPQNPDGSQGEPVRAGWDLKKNTEL